MVSSVGAFIFGFSQLLFVAVIVKAVRSGAPAPQRPWKGAHGLEWTADPGAVPAWETPPPPSVIARGAEH